MTTLAHRAPTAITRAGAAPGEREAARGAPAPARAPERRARTAADLMTRSPATVQQNASLWTAWDLLQGTGTRHLVVVDDRRRPVGVLDDRTIALEWPQGPMGAHRTPVHALVRGRTRPRVRGADDVATVARTMLGAGADAVPVVDHDGRLAGLVTLWHLAGLATSDGWGGPPMRSPARSGAER